MKEKIFDAYYDKIYFWCLKKLRNKEEAKDLVQDVFVEIYIYIDKGIEIHNIDGLVWTICFNTWKKKVRKLVKDKMIIYDEDLLQNERVDDYKIEQILYRDILNNLDDYLLTEKEKLCFKLFYQSGYNVQEISEKLDTSISNVKYYLFHGRKRVKERLKC